jgi:hypothetical protein
MGALPELTFDSQVAGANKGAASRGGSLLIPGGPPCEFRTRSKQRYGSLSLAGYLGPSGAFLTSVVSERSRSLGAG